MSLADLVTASLILGGAVWLLYRSLWKRRGLCHGCDGGGCRPPGREPPDLVRLGEPGRPPAAGPTRPHGAKATSLRVAPASPPCSDPP